jgi:pentatricopeptide repeat protein
VWGEREVKDKVKDKVKEGKGSKRGTFRTGRPTIIHTLTCLMLTNMVPLRRAYYLSALSSAYSTTASSFMPRRNVVQVKRPSKQLQRRRRARLKRRRDLVSKERHRMKSHNPKMYADRDLTMEEMAVQQSILTKDPVYAAMADELYENITNLPMEILLSNKGNQISGGKPQKLSRSELLDLTPENEIRLRLSSVIDVPELISGDDLVLEPSAVKDGDKDGSDAIGGASGSEAVSTLSFPQDSVEKCGTPGIHEQKLWDEALLKEEAEEHHEQKEKDFSSLTTTPPLRDFNHVLRVCAAHGDTDTAFQVYDTMLEHQVEPNEATMVALAAACSIIGDVEGSMRVITAWRQKFGIGESLELSTAHVTSLCNAGMVQDAEKYFYEILDNRRHPLTGQVEDIDPPLVNAMISGLSRNALYSQAWYLYHKMQNANCQFDDVTYSMMIDVCAMEGKSEKAFGIIDEMERKGYTATKVALNTVVKACARVHPTHNSQLYGDIRSANDVIKRTGEAFNKVVGYGYTPDRHTYGALLMANSRMGRPGGCFRVLTDMIIHGNIDPDPIALNHVIMSYANALTVGISEGKRAKNLAKRYIRREEKYALYGRNLDLMINDVNDRLSARKFAEHGDDEYIPSDFLLGHADDDGKSDELLHDMKFSDTGLLRPNEIGVDVDDVLNVLESGAYKIGSGMGSTVALGGEELNENVWRGDIGVIGDGRNLNLDRFKKRDNDVRDGQDGQDGQDVRDVQDVVVSEDWNGGSDLVADYSEDDWGDLLSELVRSAYTDVGLQDGNPNPDKNSLIKGASAVVEWMENSAGLELNIFTLNSYLSVIARCMFLGKAESVYLSYEEKYGLTPDARK